MSLFEQSQPLGTIDAARIYLEAQGSGLAREKAYVEGCAGKPAPTVHSRSIQAASIGKR